MADIYEYKEYQESEAVKQAQAALQTQLAQKPAAYQSQWQTSLNDAMNKIINREKFSYDLNGDALYQQYKDRYVQQGQMAMQDTMGQAAALTGGYGNSYAQSVGQQTYQSYLQELNDKIPELYQLAYQKYSDETSDLYNQYSLLGQREEMDYGRYRDSVSDFNTERDYLTGRYDSERSYDYSMYADDRDFGYGQYRDAAADAQWQKEFEEAQRQYNYANKLISKKEAMGIESTTASGSSGSSSGSSSGGGSYSAYDNDGLTAAQVKELQAALGVSQDGMYGSQSSGAAGGLSAEEAYAKYVGNSGSGSGDSMEKELNQLIATGANKSEINGYLREALQSGDITQSEYNSMKDIYAPRGYTY